MLLVTRRTLFQPSHVWGRSAVAACRRHLGAGALGPPLLGASHARCSAASRLWQQASSRLASGQARYVQFVNGLINLVKSVGTADVHITLGSI